MGISPDQFPARHPYLLRVCPISGALQKAVQTFFVVDDQEASHEEAVEPGVDRSGAFAQGKAQAPACAAQQGYAKKRLYVGRKIWGLRPRGQGF